MKYVKFATDWFEVLFCLLDKQQRAHNPIGEKLLVAITGTFEVFKDQTDRLEKMFKKKENVTFAVDALTGLMGIA